jgi:hypothetical protein
MTLRIEELVVGRYAPFLAIGKEGGEQLVLADHHAVDDDQLLFG